MSRKAKSKLKTGLAYLFVALGMLLALLGLGIDYLLPGASPGLNLPQLLIIIAGLALAAGSWRFRSGFASVRAKTAALGLVISLATLVVLEIVLTLIGIATYLPFDFPEIETNVAQTQGCDDRGCRLNYEATLANCAAGLSAGRRCIVNRQGFADTDEFVANDEMANRMRVMVMGDSFAHGYSADVGESFVETIESLLPEIVLWNTGIYNTATNQDLAAFNEFAPQMQPQLSILGFMTNDFSGNLTPLDGWTQIVEQSGVINSFRRFTYNRWGIPVERREEFVFAYAIRGKMPPVGILERIIGRTRLGTLALRLQDSLTRMTLDNSIEYRMDVTRRHLMELRDRAKALGSELLVFLIPYAEDFEPRSEEYRAAIVLFEEIGIPYLEVIDNLDPIADYAEPPDDHWNNSGHQKVGLILAKCIEAYIASGDLGDCDNVVVPTRPSAS